MLAQWWGKDVALNTSMKTSLIISLCVQTEGAKDEASEKLKVQSIQRVQQFLTTGSWMWISQDMYLREGELPSNSNCTAFPSSFWHCFCAQNQSIPCYSWWAESLCKTWPFPSVINRANSDAVRNVQQSLHVKGLSEFSALGSEFRLSLECVSVCQRWFFTEVQLWYHIDSFYVSYFHMFMCLFSPIGYEFPRGRGSVSFSFCAPWQ